MGIPSVLVTPLTLGTLRLHDWWQFWGTKMDDLKQEETKTDIVDDSAISLRNTLNELSGAEWLYFTRSTLLTAYPSEYGHKLRKAHGANKPPQLMRQLIEFFTKPGGRVLDPFAGVGGTLIGASICKKPRDAVGIEINPKWVNIYRHVLAESQGKLLPQQLLEGDCL